MVYKPLPYYTINEIRQIINTGIIEDIRILPLSVGEYVENWKEAQDICIEFSVHKDEEVRANAARGLGSIARRMKKLEKNIVKPILLKLLDDCMEYDPIIIAYIIEGIGDINFFMKWNIGKNAMRKYESNLKKNYKVRQHSI